MNTFDDPKLTAYALGELDEIERAQIEAQLAADPELRAFVEETRAFVAEVAAELQENPEVDLTAAQKQEIQAAARKIIPWPRGLLLSRLGIPLAACAVVALGLFVGQLFLGPHGEEPKPALASAEPGVAFQSKDILYPVIDGLGLATKWNLSREQAYARLGRMLDVRGVPNTDLVEIRVKGADPKESADIANSIAAAYTDRRLAEQKARAEKGLIALGEEVEKQRENVAKAAAEISQIRAEQQIVDLNPETSDDAEASGGGAPPQNYVEAKTRYLEEKKILAAAEMRLSTENMQRSIPMLPTKIWEKAEASSPKATLEINKLNRAPLTAFGTTTPPAEAESTPLSIPMSGMGGMGGSGTGMGAGGGGGAGRGGGAGGVPAAMGGYFGGIAETFRGQRDSDQPTGLSNEGFNTEAYDHAVDNPFLHVTQNPLSTFSIDVDTASYAIVRRFLKGNALPPKDAVRIEELVNYFTYQYPEPNGEDPFSVNVEIAPAPWNSAHRLARIGLKGREVPAAERPPYNLVFLLDVSGSMNEPNKLPLVQHSMRLLTERLRPEDRIAIVVYAGASGMALPSTEVRHKADILAAINRLRPGGSTNGAAGIQLAYDIAKANFIKGGANRVILCTDGDFNVGVTNQGDLVRMIEQKAKSGVFLTVLGFGMGNYKDSMLEKLADKGNGAYGYVDTAREAQKLFVDQLSGTLVTIAKDVKIQVEFNPEHVGAFRLIGYENRLLRAEDFNDDKKDAGEIGAGHTVTALYELVPAGHENELPNVDPLKYREACAAPSPSESGNAEWMTVKLRYKQPDGETSKLIEQPVTPSTEAVTSKDFQFAAAVAEFGMLLRDSPHKGSSSFAAALDLAESGMGPDREGYRHEFIDLLRLAKALKE